MKAELTADERSTQGGKRSLWRGTQRRPAHRVIPVPLPRCSTLGRALSGPAIVVHVAARCREPRVDVAFGVCCVSTSHEQPAWARPRRRRHRHEEAWAACALHALHAPAGCASRVGTRPRSPNRRSWSARPCRRRSSSLDVSSTLVRRLGCGSRPVRGCRRPFRVADDPSVVAGACVVAVDEPAARLTRRRLAHPASTRGRSPRPLAPFG